MAPGYCHNGLPVSRTQSRVRYMCIVHNRLKKWSILKNRLLEYLLESMTKRYKATVTVAVTVTVTVRDYIFQPHGGVRRLTQSAITWPRGRLSRYM
jgi:hypothetical protein